MSRTAEAPASDLVRLTVSSRLRRVDVAVPAGVPVADLVPELARRLWMLDAGTAHTGFRLCTVAGRVLESTAGLAHQGVGDGALLTLTPGTEDQPVRLHDDVAEAMGEVAQREPRVAGHPTARHVQSAVGAAGLVLGAAGLVLVGTSSAAVVAGVVALALVAAAVALSRSSPAPRARLATPLAGTGAAYAAACGSLLAPGAAHGAALPMAGAGAGALLAGLAALFGLSHRRFLAIPPVLIGGVMVAAGVLVRGTGAPLEVVLTVALVLVVLGVGSAPGLALAATGTRVAPLESSGVPAASVPVDLAGVEAGSRAARELLLAVALAVGLLLVMVVPVAASRGVAGVLIAVSCCLVVMLRTRGHRGGPEVLVALASGASGLALVAVSVFVLEPGWRPVTVLLLVVAGAAAVATSAVPTTSVRWTRLAEVAETLALAALPPCVLLVTGALGRIVG